MTGAQESNTDEWRRLDRRARLWTAIGVTPIFALITTTWVGQAAIDGDLTEFNRIFWALIPVSLLLFFAIFKIVPLEKKKNWIVRERSQANAETVAPDL